MRHCAPPCNIWFLWPTWVHNPNDIWISSALFVQLTAECHQAFLGMSFPLKIAPSHRPIWTPSNTRFLDPTQAHNPNGISIGSAIFVGLMTVADRLTDHATIQHATQSVTVGRIYLGSTTMWPKNVVNTSVWLKERHGMMRSCRLIFSWQRESTWGEKRYANVSVRSKKLVWRTSAAFARTLLANGLLLESLISEFSDNYTNCWIMPQRASGLSESTSAIPRGFSSKIFQAPNPNWWWVWKMCQCIALMMSKWYRHWWPFQSFSMIRRCRRPQQMRGSRLASRIFSKWVLIREWPSVCWHC